MITVTEREQGVRAERLTVGRGVTDVGEDGEAHVGRDAELGVRGAQSRAHEAHHVLEMRIVREQQPEDLLGVRVWLGLGRKARTMSR